MDNYTNHIPNISRKKSLISGICTNAQSIQQLMLSHSGSRKLQTVISSGCTESINDILNALLPVISNVMNDVYGNYLCQELFQVLDVTGLEICLTRLKGIVFSIITDPRGTHSFQILCTAYLSSGGDEYVVANTMSKCLPQILGNQTGCYALQHILPFFKGAAALYIIDCAFPRLPQLTMSSSGICLLKQIHLIIESKSVWFYTLMDYYTFNVLELSNHEFGNFSISHFIQTFPVLDIEMLIDAVIPYSHSLTLGKYSSNVVEAVLFKSTPVQFFEVLECILEHLHVMLNTPYGIYVVSKAVKLLPEKTTEMSKESKDKPIVLESSTLYSKKPDNLITLNDIKSRLTHVLELPSIMNESPSVKSSLRSKWRQLLSTLNEQE